MGETVNETVKLILSLSISGGLFALALFALKPFMQNKLSKSFQYYIWIVVLLRFILPFSFGINLMDFTFNASGVPQTAEETVVTSNNPINTANVNSDIKDNTANGNKAVAAGQPPQAPVTADSAATLDILKTLADNLLWIWLAGAVISAMFNITGYFRFIRYIHGAAYAVEMPDCSAAVYKSRFAPTPMLVGVIRPRIYLPDIEYADGQLKNIMLHELTHLRRHDVWLKWFSALVMFVHWFNPIVYFMRREFNRACELSCDEAVIRNLDGAAKQSYGDTLISVVAESCYPVGVLSTTMCEEKKKLKERLVAIMNYKKKTKAAVLVTAVLAVLITGGAFVFGAQAQKMADLSPVSDWVPTPMEETQLLMGTVCNIKIYDGREQETLDKAFARVAELEMILSANDSGTEVDAINENAGIKPVKVSAETLFVVKKGLEYSKKSDGGFDISVGPVVSLWRIGFPDARIPSQEEIDSALPLIDYRDVEIDEANSTVFLKRAGMKIDLGAIAKGYVADEVGVVLRENGVTSALINMGGNILALGSKNGSNWKIGIQDPNETRNEIVGVVPLINRTVVTSGIYERYLTDSNGKRYHHILSPVDGYPYDNGIQGISIICGDSVDGDGLSTTVLAMGLEKGLKFVESLPGTEAIFIMEDKTLYLTSGIKEVFELTNDAFKIAE